MNAFIGDHIKTIHDKITNLEKQNIMLLAANNKHATNFRELQLAHNALQKEFISLKTTGAASCKSDDICDLSARVDAIETQSDSNQTTINALNSSLLHKSSNTFDQISLFGPITKVFEVPTGSTHMKVLMCGGGGAGIAAIGGGGGASVFNMIIPLFDHAGYVIIRVGGGGVSAEHPDGESSLIEIITQSGERRVVEANGGRGKWGGVNSDNSLFNGDDGDTSIGGGTIFSLGTKVGGPAWTGAGGAPVSTSTNSCNLTTYTPGGNGYVNICFL